MSNLVHQYEDGYPIIWFEPNLDLKSSLETLIQTNKSLHFFSELEAALDFLQSLNRSFLMISSIDVDEERLLQNFSCLKDTHAERLSDFEEESVLGELLSNLPNFPIKSLNVHFFYSKKDVENEATPANEEEEIMLMCNVDEMVKQIREDFVILWCDPYITSKKKEFLEKEFDIDGKNIYTNFDDLFGIINNYNGPPYHLILSGQAQTDKITQNPAKYKDLLGCYIYDTPRYFQRKDKNKNLKIQKTLEKLLLKIKEGIRTKSKHKNTFPAFATNFDFRDKSHINNVHYYLRGFVNFRNRKQAKNDFINLAKKFHQSKKLFEFETEYFEYHKDKILNWYTQETPIYKLVNNGLRISTSDSILYCRFLLKDMERAIKEEYRQESNRFSGEVYRGTYISKRELETLEANIGKEIEMYGFLSTTTNLNIALKFYKTGDVDNKILITIIVPPLPLPELDEQGFANISRFSKHPNEEEILFNVRSRFQILEVGNKEIKGAKSTMKCKHLVLLYGAQLLRKYMTIQKPLVNLQIELPSELKCDFCSSESNLYGFHKEKTRIVCKECILMSSPKDLFLLPLSEDPSERNIKLEFSGKILGFFKTNPSPTNFYGYKCSECSNSRQGEEAVYYKILDPKINLTRIQCSACFESHQEFTGHLILSESCPYIFWQSKQEGWEEIDTHFKMSEFEKFDEMKGVDVFYKAQDYEKCRELSIKTLKDFIKKGKRKTSRVEFYESLGKSFHSLGAHKKALEYHLKTLNLRKLILGETHYLTAASYHNVAEVYKSLAEHQKALEHFITALDIRKQVFKGEAHFSIADSYNDIADIYYKVGEYKKALAYHGRALTITKEFYGTETHPKSANAYHNIALVHYKLGEYQKALEYHTKALDIRKSVYGEIHSDTATSYNNIAEVYRCLAKHKQANDCFEKSLEIRKCIYLVEEHPSTADSYASIASLYRSLSKPQESVKFHHKALKIRKQIFGETHPSIADSYSNLALVYNDLGEHQKALEYHQGALDITKLIFGEAHDDIAILYDNLAEGYKHLGDYNRALEYHEKALAIFKSIYGEMHPSTATSFNNLGTICNHLGEHEKALVYHLEARKIRNKIFTEVHPNIADSYSNLASVYYNQGKYDEALELYLKALDTAKLVYGEVHTSIADFYDNIGVFYGESLGNHGKALEFYRKALNLKNSIYNMKNPLDQVKGHHPSIAESYCNFASFYRSLGKYKKALKFERKALYIKRSIFGETHPETASSHHTFALTLSNFGSYHKVIKHYMRALDVRKSTYGKEHFSIADSYHNLAIVYSRLGEHEKALEYNWRALNMQKSAFKNSDMASYYNKIALGNFRLGKYQRAVNYFIKALDLKNSLNEEMDPLTADLYSNLAVVENERGEFRRAINYHFQALHVRTSLFGEKHPDTVESYSSLAMTYENLGDFQEASNYFAKVELYS